MLVLPCGNTDISQFRDALEAAIMLYGLSPIFSRPFRFLREPSDRERRRRQRDASALIRTACGFFEANDDGDMNSLRLLITNEDLFIQKMNFVFGLADKALRTAAVSIKRLVAWTDGLTSIQIQERILKEAAHEVGHLVGLGHCADPFCLMSFSETLEKVDSKLPTPCADCLLKARKLCA